eukprot:TRINITY_DN16714_c0_g1_i1.p1 TRINITY_DN16714_c0_g1~~TRINITY_DN16714_c0_g1_i1.p1  ORF type:complete len:207 (+),score=33.09 TRINITY_DN16714_c0_g1_i1:49-669(+)
MSDSPKPKLLDKRTLRDSKQGVINDQKNKEVIALEQLSYPPTYEELNRLDKLNPSALPRKYHRKLDTRVFVNRSLRLDRIEWIGFDMDYTLAVYKDAVESLAYDIAVGHLLDIGYPKSISKLKYDPSFPIRGLFLDKELGNYLKVDNFGSILLGIHGRTPIPKRKLYEVYPSGRVILNDIGRRFHLFDTLFTMPEMCLYADLVDHF